LDTLRKLEKEIIGCQKCPRLREHCLEIARTKRRAYREETYWGLPVPGFGDPRARLFILGLAPGAHGANRTGRLFTGDSSGDFLYRALYETGFASQAESISRDDGLRLKDAWISASARCAPPGNKPLPSEVVTCRTHLQRELALLPRVQVVVALGKLAFDNYLRTAAAGSGYEFGHGRQHRLDAKAPLLIASYHPSRQNTQTGRLTAEMLRDVFVAAREELK
jgi:uracil-DNA glycosylase family 4